MLGKSWKEILQAQPELLSIDNWPYINPFDVESNKRKKFIRNRNIVTEMIQDNLGKTVAKKYGVSPSQITYLMSRCLSPGEDGYPVLSTALIPGQHIKNGNRKARFSTVIEPKGSRGAFEKLLKEVPEIRKTWEEMIFAYVKQKKNAQNINPIILRSEMIRILQSKGWSNQTYPLKDSSVAYESIRKYLIKETEKLKTPKVKRLIYSKPLSVMPFQEIQIDAQTVDIHMSILLDIDGDEFLLRLSRVTLFMAVDVATNAIVAYHLCLTKSPNQQDLLTLLNNIFIKWKPIKLTTPGLDYVDEASMPSCVIDKIHMIGLNMVSLDNALCHLASTVRFYICENLGATLNLGLPKSPKRRNFIEYAFHVLNQTVHRFPSTTGSHILDKNRESPSNKKSPPILSLKAFEEVLDVVITDYNSKPQKRLASYSPVGMIKQLSETQPLRFNFDNEHKRHEPFIAYKQATIRCIVKEDRNPHVSFKGLRYSSPGFIDKRLRGKKVKLKYDIRDIREIQIQTLDGKVISDLRAPRTYQRYKLSISTLDYIKELTTEKIKLGKDPIAGVMAYLLKNKDLPQTALKISHLHKEMSCETEESQQVKDVKEKRVKHNNIVPIDLAAPRKIGKWSEELGS